MQDLVRAALAAVLLVPLGGCDEQPKETDGGATVPSDAGPTDASADAGPDLSDAGPRCDGPPGLYPEGTCTEPDVGVRPYQPRFELWADGAEKERYIYLPPGSRIDTTDPNQWVFPAGTRIYKTFLRDGVRLETRLLEKTDPGVGLGAWDMRAYAWNEAQNAVEDVTNQHAGIRENVLGTDHNIPSGADCVRCHGGLDVVNGFSAIMLNHDGGGVTLQTLIDDSLLTQPISPADAEVPGDPTAVEALGYLHANCGHCHRENSSDPLASSRGLWMWLNVGTSSVETADAYVTAVGEIAEFSHPGAPCRIHPGHPDTSLILARMEDRDGLLQMPPLATKHVHTEGVNAVRAWIATLADDAPECVP